MEILKEDKTDILGDLEIWRFGDFGNVPAILKEDKTDILGFRYFDIFKMLGGLVLWLPGCGKVDGSYGMWWNFEHLRSCFKRVALKKIGSYREIGGVGEIGDAQFRGGQILGWPKTRLFYLLRHPFLIVCKLTV